MDTFEWTKIGGALCGALLIFLLLNWGTELIYHIDNDHYGEEKLAYYLEVEVSDDDKLSLIHISENTRLRRISE